MKIPLTQGKFAEVDKRDYIRLRKYKWHLQKGYGDVMYASRAVTNPDGSQTIKSMHREILDLHYSWHITDHKDRNGLNNRRSNLRVCNHTLNHANCKTIGRRKFKGVSKIRDRWRAYINSGNKRFHLGQYATIEEAAKAYDKAALKIFGEFARINFPTTC